MGELINLDEKASNPISALPHPFKKIEEVSHVYVYKLEPLTDEDFKTNPDLSIRVELAKLLMAKFAE
jgi:hypothetical protein